MDRQCGINEIYFRFKKQKISVVSFYGILFLFFAAVYAPLFIGNLPLVAFNSRVWISFPVAYRIFNPDGPEIILDKLYNYLIFFIPLFFLYLKFIKFTTLRGCKEINFTIAMNPGAWIRGASPERMNIREGRSNKEDKPQDFWPERLAFFRLLIVALVRYIFSNMLLACATIINPKYSPANVKGISLQPLMRFLCFIIIAAMLLFPFCYKWNIHKQYVAKESNSFVIMPLIPYTPYELSGMPYENISVHHLMGTDSIGRDILARIVYGARISLAVGVFATLIALFIGTSIGLFSGYSGGVADIIIMRIVEIVVCFPVFLLLLILMASMMDIKFEQSCLIIIPIIGILTWTPFARISRGEVLKQRNLAYVQSCEIFGMSKVRIMFNHILPNILGSITVTTIFAAATNILAETGLSFLGFGVQAPTASWGELLKEAFSDPLRYWNLTLWPGLIIFLTILCINLVGEGLKKSIGEE